MMARKRLVRQENYFLFDVYYNDYMKLKKFTLLALASEINTKLERSSERQAQSILAQH